MLFQPLISFKKYSLGTASAGHLRGQDTGLSKTQSPQHKAGKRDQLMTCTERLATDGGWPFYTASDLKWFVDLKVCLPGDSQSFNPCKR